MASSLLFGVKIIFLFTVATDAAPNRRSGGRWQNNTSTGGNRHNNNNARGRRAGPPINEDEVLVPTNSQSPRRRSHGMVPMAGEILSGGASSSSTSHPALFGTRPGGDPPTRSELERMRRISPSYTDADIAAGCPRGAEQHHGHVSSDGTEVYEAPRSRADSSASTVRQPPHQPRPEWLMGPPGLVPMPRGSFYHPEAASTSMGATSSNDSKRRGSSTKNKINPTLKNDQLGQLYKNNLARRGAGLLSFLSDNAGGSSASSDVAPARRELAGENDDHPIFVAAREAVHQTPRWAQLQALIEWASQPLFEVKGRKENTNEFVHCWGEFKSIHGIGGQSHKINDMRADMVKVYGADGKLAGLVLDRPLNALSETVCYKHFPDELVDVKSKGKVKNNRGGMVDPRCFTDPQTNLAMRRARGFKQIVNRAESRTMKSFLPLWIMTKKLSEEEVQFLCDWIRCNPEKVNELILKYDSFLSAPAVTGKILEELKEKTKKGAQQPKWWLDLKSLSLSEIDYQWAVEYFHDFNVMYEAALEYSGNIVRDSNNIVMLSMEEPEPLTLAQAINRVISAPSSVAPSTTTCKQIELYQHVQDEEQQQQAIEKKDHDMNPVYICGVTEPVPPANQSAYLRSQNVALGRDGVPLAMNVLPLEEEDFSSPHAAHSASADSMAEPEAEPAYPPGISYVEHFPEYVIPTGLLDDDEEKMNKALFEQQQVDDDTSSAGLFPFETSSADDGGSDGNNFRLLRPDIGQELLASAAFDKASFHARQKMKIVSPEPATIATRWDKDFSSNKRRANHATEFLWCDDATAKGKGKGVQPMVPAAPGSWNNFQAPSSTAASSSSALPPPLYIDDEDAASITAVPNWTYNYEQRGHNYEQRGYPTSEQRGPLLEPRSEQYMRDNFYYQSMPNSERRNYQSPDAARQQAEQMRNHAAGEQAYQLFQMRTAGEQAYPNQSPYDGPPPENNYNYATPQPVGPVMPPPGIPQGLHNNGMFYTNFYAPNDTMINSTAMVTLPEAGGRRRQSHMSFLGGTSPPPAAFVRRPVSPLTCLENRRRQLSEPSLDTEPRCQKRALIDLYRERGASVLARSLSRDVTMGASTMVEPVYGYVRI